MAPFFIVPVNSGAQVTVFVLCPLFIRRNQLLYIIRDGMNRFAASILMGDSLSSFSRYIYF
jgi:hypothetical protein